MLHEQEKIRIMKNAIEILKKEIEKQSNLKLITERERESCKDIRFEISSSNKINRINDLISELNKAIDILENQ